MTMKLNTKKKIAREVLLFLGTIALTGLFYLGIILWNLLLDYSIVQLRGSIGALEKEVQELPVDRIWELYHNKIEKELVVNYRWDNESFAIPKKKERDFFLGVYPPVRFINYEYAKKIWDYVNSNPNINVHVSKDEFFRKYWDRSFNQFKLHRLLLREQKKAPIQGFVVDNILSSFINQAYKEKVEGRSKHTVKLPPSPDRYYLFGDSIYVFDFVGIDEFRTLIQDNSYRNKLYDFILIECDVGTRKEYERKIEEGLLFDESIRTKSIELKQEITDKQNNLKNNELNVVHQKYILRIILTFWFVVLGLIYPVRFMYILLRWSIKTIRQ